MARKAVARIHHEGARQWLRRTALALAMGASGVVGSAWAADVDLTVAIGVPTQTDSLVPFDYTVTLGNALTGSTAANARVEIPLPAHLYGVTVQNVVASGTPGTACPAAAAFAGQLPDAVTTGAQALVATVPNLPAGGFCVITVRATPLVGNTYKMQARIQPAGGDAEVLAATNTAEGNTVGRRSSVPLKVDKRIVAGAAPDGLGSNVWNAAGYGAAHPVVFELEFQNQSAFPLPLGAIGSVWSDWESDGGPQHAPSGSTISGLTCAQGPCPPLTQGVVNVNQGSNVIPVDANLSGYVMPPKSTVRIQYTRTYDAPTCGSSKILNDITWTVNRDGQFIDPVWQTNSYNPMAASNISRLTLNFPDAGACRDVPIEPILRKTLDRVTDAAGGVTRPNFQVQADGDVAHFTITIDNTRTRNVPDAANPIPFTLWDQIRSLLSGGINPTFAPDGAVRQEIRFEGCQAGNTRSVCPNPANPTIYGPSTNFNYGRDVGLGVLPGDVLRVAAGDTMTLRFSTRYTLAQPLVCVRNNTQLENFARLTARAAPAGYAYTGRLQQEVSTDGKLSLFPNMPRCADVASNKHIAPANPGAGDEITFTLDYVNSTALTTGNPHNAPKPLTNVQVRDVLGPHFTPSSAACRVQSGNAQAPTVSRANIGGPENTFNAVIPSMDEGAMVRCEIKGSVSAPGSYRNVTVVSLPPGSGLVDPYPQNDEAALNYGILYPQRAQPALLLGKAVQLAGNQVTYTVQVDNVGNAPVSNARVTDTLPAGISNPQWTCAGSACPAPNGAGHLNAQIANLPVGGRIVWTITGTRTSQAAIVNEAQAELPPGVQCAGATPGAPLTAGPCRASATLPAASGEGGGSVTAVPVNAPWALFMLAGMLAILGGMRQQRRR
ncbi:DUF11 domain-containing protein [Comamonadaceae bacterium OH2545_COT-014]|nr:DUF11 domain-containing protein [Comamonadaceae bacterium OH2545_COT-014]